jgi:hypothetical protein
METKVSLQYSQDPINGPFPQPDEYSPQLSNLFL